MKAIFTSKPESIYEDLIEFRYHFPRTYLNQVQQAIGDWIIYYEPRRLSTALNRTGGRQAYFATARVLRVEVDANKEDHFFAYVSDYLEFDKCVPFKDGAKYHEQALLKSDGSTNKGAFGRSVRIVSDVEYDNILRAGFEIALIGEDQYYQHQDTVSGPEFVAGFGENETASYERPVIESVVKRPFRDEAFRHAVRAAYGMTCSMTGLKIINGGGRPEVQAAHIKAVAANGPDSVRNGLALSGTVHWMFDRGLISVDEDYTILTAKSYLPPQAESFLNATGKILVPERAEFRPHPQFMAYHRERVFKG